MSDRDFDLDSSIGTDLYEIYILTETDWKIDRERRFRDISERERERERYIYYSVGDR